MSSILSSFSNKRTGPETDILLLFSITQNIANNNVVYSLTGGWETLHEHITQLYANIINMNINKKDDDAYIFSSETISLLYSFSFKLSKQNNRSNYMSNMKLELEKSIIKCIKTYFVSRLLQGQDNTELEQLKVFDFFVSVSQCSDYFLLTYLLVYVLACDR